ncbi:MAG: NAD(P)H-hydrate dehydratase [Clostridia bacterium]|nr:NAD(P)H-hydrate dehydratase [Clostridia bacterium]
MSDYSVFSYTMRDLTLLPLRPARSHKGTFGRVLCVCGSSGMSGAAYFAAKAAYRMGAGLVRIYTIQENRAILQTLIPEAIVTEYNEASPNMEEFRLALQWADVWVVGCGLGVNTVSRTILAEILRAPKKPTILDADALNLLALNPSLLGRTQGAILTPHAAEMSRLCGKSVEKILEHPKRTAYEFAKQHGVICVLKDHHTVVSDGGPRLYLNPTGNSGMATGGAGDILAGLLGGLFAQLGSSCPDPLSYTALGVYLHGLCGDHAAQALSEYAVMARDLLDALPKVLKQAESFLSDSTETLSERTDP